MTTEKVSSVRGNPPPVVRATAARVITVVEQMLEMPWLDADESNWWRIDGFDGQSNDLTHMLALGARRHRDLLPGLVAALDERWGDHREFALADHADPNLAEDLDLRDHLARRIRGVGGTSALWWRASSHRAVVAVVTARSPLLRRVVPGRIGSVLVVPAEMRGGLPTAPEAESPGVATRDLVWQALSYPWSESDQQSFRTPPHPVPTGLQPWLERLEDALPSNLGHPKRDVASSPYGDGPLPAGAVRGAAAMARVGVSRLVLHLLMNGALTSSDGDRWVEAVAATDLPITNRSAVVLTLRCRLVERHLLDDDVAAERSVGSGAAAWRLKTRLVQSLAVREGWRAAIELCGRSWVGPAFLRDAFHPSAYGYDDLLTLFTGDAAGVLDELDEVHCLIAAAAASHSPAGATDHHGVEGLLTRISAIDPGADPKAVLGVGEPPVRFADINVKLAVVHELIMKGLLPRFSLGDHAAEHGYTVDETARGAVPEALAHFEALDVPAELTIMITDVLMDRSNEIYQQIAPHWDGKDALFDVKHVTDFRHLPNLTTVTVLYSGGAEGLQGLRDRDIEVERR